MQHRTEAGRLRAATPIGPPPGRALETDGFEALLEAVRAARTVVNDPSQAEALGEELLALENADNDATKSAAVHRLVGMAKLLGQVTVPILETANKVKDLIS